MEPGPAWGLNKGSAAAQTPAPVLEVAPALRAARGGRRSSRGQAVGDGGAGGRCGPGCRRDGPLILVLARVDGGAGTALKDGAWRR